MPTVTNLRRFSTTPGGNSDKKPEHEENKAEEAEAETKTEESLLKNPAVMFGLAVAIGLSSVCIY